MAKWTTQSLIDGNMKIHAYCHDPACRHHQPLDLLKLRDKLGPDALAMADDLTPKLRCSKCGGKKIGLIYSPNTGISMGGAYNYLKASKGQ
jgi:hypothetical protein